MGASPSISCTMSDGAKLAVALRSAQWALDDLAHDLPAGRATPARLRELADALDALARLLHEHAGLSSLLDLADTQG